MQANEIDDEGPPLVTLEDVYAAFSDLDPAGLDIAINQNWPE